jgi:hypothetical protein
MTQSRRRRPRLPHRRPHRSRRPLAVFAAALAAAFLLAAPAAANRAPLSLDEIEIQGERLVPPAVYIVGGAEADSLAAATVSDYLALVAPTGDNMPFVLVFPESR